MTTKPSVNGRLASFRDMLAYTTGDGATSLVINSMMSFVMLYYTEALGVDYRLAGLAISVAIFWNAVTEPVMGHITDNTRSRFGRRHPYMLVGGLATVFCFLAVWMIPHAFRAPHLLFWYLVFVNLLLRTAITVFSVPHGALGFEVCTDYTQRTTLQGMRVAFNMLINLAGPAMAWALFFPNTDGIESTSVASNYMRMGCVFSVAALGFVLLVVFATRQQMSDTRGMPRILSNHPVDMLRSIAAVILDRCPRPVFVFTSIAFIGMSLVAALEVYVYIHVMQFSSVERAIVHGAGIVACGLGGVLSPHLVRRVDKKAAICIAMVMAAAANLMLAVLFVPTWGLPGTGYCISEVVGRLEVGSLPAGMLLFAFFHALYWAGNGIMTPVAVSMIADASEISRYRTGVLKDGTYSSVFSCITKLSMSVGLLLSGFCLKYAGFLSGGSTQSPQALRNLAMATFLGGAAIAMIAVLGLLRYSVTRDYMAQLRKRDELTALDSA
jgi:glycoside/pentoside/hexuronide:cation symporter, GPH family